MHKVLHNVTTKSLVDKQTLPNSFMSAKATNTVNDTLELTEFNVKNTTSVHGGDPWYQKQGRQEGETSPW